MPNGPRTKARKSVEAFINSVSGKRLAGGQCLVCSSPHCDEINNSAIAFNEQRALWGTFQTDPDTGAQVPMGTHVSWDCFVKDFLKAKGWYVGSDKRPLIRHLEKHVGLKIS